jgi:hypothetical protein
VAFTFTCGGSCEIIARGAGGYFRLELVDRASERAYVSVFAGTAKLRFWDSFNRK